jgi:hypothetical protein
MFRRQVVISVLLVGLLLVPTIESGPSPASAADFDQDGYADLAIGVEGETVSGGANAGAVNVLYGSSGGISYILDQIWVQEDLANLEGSEADDGFGKALAAGDFDGDGVADLAVGLPGEDIGVVVDAGAVHIVYGSAPGGLVTTGNQYFHQNVLSMEDEAEFNDRYGSALAAGDFNGDGRDDLAVGVPWESFDLDFRAGAVSVLYGTADGLSASGDQFWYEGTGGLGGDIVLQDECGTALTAGDFDGDGYDDLAVSTPGEDLAGVLNVGRVVILYGSADGLTTTGSQGWVQGQNGVQDIAEEDDYFGETLASGDFNGDGCADLAIGTPQEEVVLQDNAGRVNILYGSPEGLTAEGDIGFTFKEYTADDEFGRALAAGDFNGDGFDELAVGIPYEDLYSWANIGAVEILYGASSGLHRRSAWDDIWSQNRTGMEDDPQLGDWFGAALAAGDFNDDLYADLAVGIPRQDVWDGAWKVDAGAIHILYGSADGIAVTGNQFWHQDSTWVEGIALQDDHFGSSLVAIPSKTYKVFLPVVISSH